MFWPIYVYVIGSFVMSASAAVTTGLSAGFCAVLSSGLFVIAGGGFKAGLRWGSRSQRVKSFIGAAILLSIAVWLSYGFSVQIFDYALTGAEWGWAGFAICFVFANRRLVGM